MTADPGTGGSTWEDDGLMSVVEDAEQIEPHGDPSDETAASDDVEDLEPLRDDRPVRRAVDALVVAGSALFVFVQLHPGLIIADTTPAGGDMGAHVWAFGYLRDVLLPDLRLSGWTPDWYAGFPAFHFYMVVPFLGMVVLNAGFSGVAALVPAAGSLALAYRAWGRRIPAVAGVAAGIGLVALIGGVWFSFGTGYRLLLMVVASGVAVAGLAAPTARSGSRRRTFLLVLAIVIALGGIALPYGVSFKLISISGVVAMPVAAYLFGRLARLPFPTPALLSVAVLAFLFDTNFTIYGGNIASTMAGEFAFSISLALALAYLGVLVHGLRTGTHRATAAVLLALVGLCHLIPAFFALAATAVLLLVHVVAEAPVGPGRPRVRARVTALLACAAVVACGALALVLGLGSLAPVVAVSAVVIAIIAILWWARLGPEQPEVSADGADAEDSDATGRFVLSRTWWLLSMGVVGGLLAMWWVLPFFWRRTYLNDMGWGKIGVHTDGVAIWDWFANTIWPELVHPDLVVFAALALVGAVLSLAFRHRIGSALVILGILLAAAFVFVPQGRLWNARLLPFWYLVIYLLAAVAVGEVVRAVAQVVAARPERPVRWITWVSAPLALLVLGSILGAQLRNLPGGRTNDDGTYRAVASVGIPGVFSVDVPDWMAVDVSGSNLVAGWSRWNYTGYEGKDAYPEYRDIVTTMAEVGEDHGCGMSLWEYNQDLNEYGTPMALMLLPHWTDGCIGSMEGLYFEASSTTPFHFLMQSELSASPSRAQRDMPYRELDMTAGVEHMQLMGVRYYLAKTAEANAAAAGHPDLDPVAASGPWVVYRVADSPMVTAVENEPAVTTASEAQATWLGCSEGEPPCPGVALEWFQDPSTRDVLLAAGGPDDWQRVDPGQQPEVRPVTPAAVGDVEVGRDGISFTVDRPGTPVLVKQSYFPTWTAQGAEGPWRVAPNLMLVVPTDTEVSLHYQRTALDWLAILLSLMGVVLAVALARRGPVAVRRLRDDESDLAPRS